MAASIRREILSRTRWETPRGKKLLKTRWSSSPRQTCWKRRNKRICQWAMLRCAAQSTRNFEQVQSQAISQAILIRGFRVGPSSKVSPIISEGSILLILHPSTPHSNRSQLICLRMVRYRTSHMEQPRREWAKWSSKRRNISTWL